MKPELIVQLTFSLATGQLSILRTKKSFFASNRCPVLDMKPPVTAAGVHLEDSPSLIKFLTLRNFRMAGQ